jgi:hypothetical protein
MEQIELVYNHLMRYGSITSMEAFNDYKITRLAAIIFKLKKKGMQINSSIVGSKRFARYSLADERTLQEELQYE